MFYSKPTGGVIATLIVIFSCYRPIFFIWHINFHNRIIKHLETNYEEK